MRKFVNCSQVYFTSKYITFRYFHNNCIKVLRCHLDVPNLILLILSRRDRERLPLQNALPAFVLLLTKRRLGGCSLPVIFFFLLVRCCVPVVRGFLFHGGARRSPCHRQRCSRRPSVAASIQGDTVTILPQSLTSKPSFSLIGL